LEIPGAGQAAGSLTAEVAARYDGRRRWQATLARDALSGTLE
jgi:hypothetical protein